MAVAVWAAAGLVTLAGDDTSQRLIVPASPVWLIAGGVVGLALPACRQAPPVCTWPALLTILPWLPIPLPAICLLWTGPLAWVPVGVTIVSALAAGRRASTAAAAPRTIRVRTSAVTAGLATFVAGGLVLHAVGARLPGGDEPHYLIITQSLLQDGDLRIANNHASRDYAAYWGGDLDPHVIQRGRDGELYSIHAPGVAVLVAPLFAWFGLAGAQWTLIGLAAIGGALVWLAGWKASGRLSAAWFAWAAVSGSVTMLVQSVMIFPDGPGAVIVAAAAVLWLRLEPGRQVPVAATMFVSGLLAILPFFHTRFVVLSIGLGIAIAVRLWMAAEPRNRIAGLARFFALPAVGAAAWFGYFYVLYGTVNPAIPYGAISDSRLVFAPGGLLGLLVDQQFGLFSYAPVLALVLVGWGIADRRASGPTRTWPLAIVAIAYLVAVCTYWMWWAGGPATPARLATSILPLLAAPLALVWRDSGVAGRTVAATLLATSLAISLIVLGTANGDLAWSVRDGQAAWLWAAGPVVDLPRAWPSFFWRLIGGDVRSELPFAAHVAAWGAVAALGGAAGLAAVRASRGRRPGVVAAWGLLFGAMAAAQIGWWLNGTSGLRPAPSQMALLRASVDGRRVYAVAPWRVARVQDDPVPVQITIPRIDLPMDQHAAWAEVRNIPAGTYDMTFSAPRPTEGTLTTYTVLDREPFATVVLPRRSRHTWTMDLPVATTAMHVEADTTLAGADGTLRLTPRSLAPGPFLPAAARLRLAGLDVLVLDGEPFVEGRAMWVRGAGSVALALTTADPAGKTSVLHLANGPGPNRVVVTIDGSVRHLDLGASETIDVPVPVSPAAAVRVHVESPAGFKPSDDGVSRDARYLGVWLTFGDASRDDAPRVVAGEESRGDQ
ncbi:MAG: hypothetical protein ABS36_19355 [Acidobacteria bacterium SCN 69-37]|nr:MAG: hypothetical protein ABS36_19355 [Acidobacteria bacterium SCN 69-37]